MSMCSKSLVVFIPSARSDRRDTKLIQSHGRLENMWINRHAQPIGTRLHRVVISSQV